MPDDSIHTSPSPADLTLRAAHAALALSDHAIDMRRASADVRALFSSELLTGSSVEQTVTFVLCHVRQSRGKNHKGLVSGLGGGKNNFKK